MSEQGQSRMGQRERGPFNPRLRALELLNAGRSAAVAGQTQYAHDLLRHAALLNPEDENVWWVLLEVVDDPEDKRVCLENILTINPESESARRRLNDLNRSIGEQKPSVGTPGKPRQIGRAVVQLLVTIVVLLGLMMLGIMIGVMLNQV